MKFEVLGRDNGKNVVKMEDGTVKHLTDRELADLKGEVYVPDTPDAKEAADITKDRDEWKAKAEKSETELANLAKKVEGLEKANEGLVKNRDEWKAKAQEAEKQLKELSKK